VVVQQEGSGRWVDDEAAGEGEPERVGTVHGGLRRVSTWSGRVCRDL